MSTLEDIKARAEKATAGPWEVANGEWGTSSKRLTMVWAGARDEREYIMATAFAESPADAALIAAAPKLLAALEAVEAHHQPMMVKAYDRSEIPICTTCSDDVGNWERYPCPTLTSITEALA